MVRPALLSGWSLEGCWRQLPQMNDYPRQNPAYRLTCFLPILLRIDLIGAQQNILKMFSDTL